MTEDNSPRAMALRDTQPLEAFVRDMRLVLDDSEDAVVELWRADVYRACNELDAAIARAEAAERRGAQDEWRIDLEERLRMFVAQGQLDQSVLDSYRAERSRLAAAERVAAAGRTFHHASRYGQMIGDVFDAIDAFRAAVEAYDEATAIAESETPS